MNLKELKQIQASLDKFAEWITDGLGRRERRDALAMYLAGLLLDGERKSIQPMASRLVQDEHAIEPLRQRLQQAVAVASWAEATIYQRIAARFDAEFADMQALIVDDTGFAKKGDQSVGVCRQYSGTLGRVDNCQIATSLHLAATHQSVCIGQRLYLPESWANDTVRCRKAGIPADICFARKWEIALTLIDQALDAGIRKHVVLADAGYGDATSFRCALQARDMTYLMGVSATTTIWPPPIIPKIPTAPKKAARGRPQTRAQATWPPMTLAAFASSLTRNAFVRVSWRRGTKGMMRGDFYAQRIYSAERRTKGTKPPLAPIWVLIERTDESSRPFKYYVSNLPADTSLKQLVSLAKLRWRVERDYQDLKGELGLDHFEGRTWSGFHHHAALCAAAHAFMVLQRRLFSPAHPTLVAA